MLLKLHQVTFTHEQGTAPLFAAITAHFSLGWTGIVGANGTGKTTLLGLACGQLLPQEGQVQARGTVVYCAQQTDEPPPLLGRFLQAADGDACRLRGQLEIAADWAARWTTLSHGERKRAQIAVAFPMEGERFSLWIRDEEGSLQVRENGLVATILAVV